MAIWLEVQTTNVPGNPVKPKRVAAGLDGGSLQPLRATASGMGWEIEVTKASRIEIQTGADEHWDVRQVLNLTPGDPPVIEPTDATYNPYDYEINVDPPVIHTRGTGDWEVTVKVRFSHIRDAENRAREILKLSHEKGWAQQWDTEMDFDLSRSCSTRLLHRFALGPPGSVGSDRLDTDILQGSPEGTLYFFERTKVPKLVLVWQPPNVDILNSWYEEMPVPLHYHIFFHPSIPWPDHPPGEEAYPWNFDSLNLPHRYLMGRPPHPPNDPTPDQFNILFKTNKNKHMLHQLAATEAGINLIYPVGAAAGWLGDIVTQAGALLLLQEINHFLQRRAAAPVAEHPIGRIGVSGFSYGYRGPVLLATSPRVSEFDDNWDEIYNFDGNEGWFLEPTRNWFQRRPDKRRLRIYSQSGMWDAIANMPPFSKSQIDKRFGAKETESFAGSVIHTPWEFWNSAFKVSDSDAIHQVMPAIFFGHAVKNWFFV